MNALSWITLIAVWVATINTAWATWGMPGLQIAVASLWFATHVLLLLDGLPK